MNTGGLRAIVLVVCAAQVCVSVGCVSDDLNSVESFAKGPSLSRDRAHYNPGEVVYVTYQGVSDLTNVWILLALENDPTGLVTRQPLTTSAGTLSFSSVPDGRYVARIAKFDNFWVRHYVTQAETPVFVVGRDVPISFGNAPLHRVYMLSSHNTYQQDHGLGPGEDSIVWNFDNSTRNIEIDLRDTHESGAMAGNWKIAHGYDENLTTQCGGEGASTLSWCLSAISGYHWSHPNHPLITVMLDKKQHWEDFDHDTVSRSPWRLDNLIAGYLPDAAIFRPMDMYSPAGLRSRVMNEGWPVYDSLAGKVMFIMTAEKADNDILEQYALDRAWDAKVFVGPYAISYNDVVVCPSGFDSSSVEWVAFYGFEWVDSDNDGQCDAAECRQIVEAYSRNFLTRVFDIDDYREADTASRGPFTGGSGYANFIAEDHPWLYHGDPDDGGGYGEHPDGIYP